MREYKSRVWYEPGQIMVYPVWNDEVGTYVFGMPSPHGLKEVVLGSVLKRHHFKPMLFVGIQDRAGHDIYEDDIVRRWKGGTELPASVVQHTPEFWWDNIRTDFEVLGNTYENGDLLSR